MKPISRKTEIDGNDDNCNICGLTASIVIQGSSNCNYCGNQINLCLECGGRALGELEGVLREYGKVAE